jgi:hypothetical protein
MPKPTDDELNAAASLEDFGFELEGDELGGGQEDAEQDVNDSAEGGEQELGEAADEAAKAAADAAKEVKDLKKDLKDEDDPAEKSRLGRKIKTIEQKFDSLSDKLEQLILLQTLNAENAERKPEPEQEDEDAEALITKADLQKLIPEYIRKQKEAETGETEKYRKGYIKEVTHKLGVDLSDDEHSAVVKIMLSKYNAKETGDPKIDAQLNFLKAERDWVALGGKATVKSKLRQQKAPGHDDESGADKGKAGVGEDLLKKLDPAAADYAKKMGFTNDQIKKAFNMK